MGLFDVRIIVRFLCALRLALGTAQSFAEAGSRIWSLMQRHRLHGSYE